MEDVQTVTFVSDGSTMPAGQYLVTIDRSTGRHEIAWRPTPDRSIVWSPPVMAGMP